jgi:Luciferase-like monooxygenase
MAFQLGVYSFGNTPLGPDGTTGRTGQAIRDLIKAIQLAEAVGLDFFGIGEHHTLNMPVSSPTSVINAAAAVTHRIGLGSTVTVLSTRRPTHSRLAGSRSPPAGDLRWTRSRCSVTTWRTTTRCTRQSSTCCSR